MCNWVEKQFVKAKLKNAGKKEKLNHNKVDC